MPTHARCTQINVSSAKSSGCWVAAGKAPGRLRQLAGGGRMAARTPPKTVKGITEPTRSAARDCLYHAFVSEAAAGGGDDLPRREEAQVRGYSLARTHDSVIRAIQKFEGSASFRLLSQRSEHHAHLRLLNSLMPPRESTIALKYI